MEAVQRVEQTPYDYLPTRRAPRAGPSLLFGKTSTAISARSGTTPGSGSVILQASTTSTITATSTTITAYNFSAIALLTGKYCVLASAGGLTWIISVEC